MIINKKGTYTIEQDHYVFSIDYTYYYDSGTYEDPPVEDIEITSVELNGDDITDFYWDFVEETRVNDYVLDHARNTN